MQNILRHNMIRLYRILCKSPFSSDESRSVSSFGAGRTRVAATTTFPTSRLRRAGRTTGVPALVYQNPFGHIGSAGGLFRDRWPDDVAAKPRGEVCNLLGWGVFDRIDDLLEASWGEDRQ
jgi:hypothetical protein